MKKIRYNFLHSFAQIVVLTKSELRCILSDGGVLLLFFGATIIYPLIYSACYHSEVLREVPISVIDFDKTPMSRMMVRIIDASPEVAVSYMAEDLEDAKQAFYDGKIHGVILIPNDFEKSLLSNVQTSVITYADATYMLYYKQVVSGVNAAVQQFNLQAKTDYLVKTGIPHAQARLSATPVHYLSEPLYNSASGYGSYAMPALLVLILQQSMLIGIGMLAGSEREKGLRSYIQVLWLLSGKVYPLIIGKLMAYLIIYLPISVFMLFLIPHWFNFPMATTLWEIIRFSVPFLLAVGLLGLLLSTLFKSREQSIIILVFTSIPIIFLSGFSWPVEAFPIGFKYLSMIFPSTYAIKGYIQLASMGANFSVVSQNWYELWILALAFAICLYLILLQFSRKILRGQLNSK